MSPALSFRRFAFLAILVAFSLCWTATSSRADARSDCSGVDATFTSANTAELRAAVICLTNRERIARGMAPLTEESHLTAAAQSHSKDMALNNYFDHTNLLGATPSDRANAAGYTNGWIGENIAAGYGSPFLVMTGWMKSGGHCANILNAPYVEIGIGVAKEASSKYGTYWTMVLGGHNSSAATVTVSCPYPGLADGVIPVPRAPEPGATVAAKAKVSSVKRRSDGRYRVKGYVTPAAKDVLITLKIKRGAKTRKYSVRPSAAGSFAKTVRAPSGSGKVRVSAVVRKI